MNSAEQFEIIVNEHYEGLYRFALSLTRSESDAGDLVQQTFYVWATKGHQLRDISKVKTWLFTTLHRAFLETRRRQTRFSHCELSESEHELPDVAPEVVTQLDCSQVLSALAEVDETYRAAVALFYLDSCPYKEIAAILEIPVGTVKSRVSRGVEQLRKILLSENVRPSASEDCCLTLKYGTKISDHNKNGERVLKALRISKLKRGFDSFTRTIDNQWLPNERSTATIF